MKLNWGYRVTLLYIGFVGLIAYLMYRSINEKIDLVTPDYYAEELKYQDRIESVNRNNALETPVAITLSDNGVLVSFPESFKDRKLEGTIHLFRPSDNTLDLSFPIKTDTNMSQSIGESAMKPGLYHVQVDYLVDGESYYTEKKLVVKRK